MKKNKKPSPKNAARSGAKHTNSYRGIIEITRSGMGYVTVESLHRDILIRPQYFDKALNGDTVEVAIIKHSGSGKLEGAIQRVIQRKQIEELIRRLINLD